jgi:dolichol-phosphate mannosyltransferase
MDADGSHPVDALPQMVRTILDDKADIVVGSRHVPGGGSKDWPLFSQFKSKLAATLALGVTSMTDPTTGFLAARRSMIERLNLDPVGWKIVLEIVVKAAPVRISEVPIIFIDRELGVSKQSLGVFAEYLAHLAKLYTHRYPALSELVKFCVVGVLGLCLDLATVIACKETWQLDTRLCAVFGFIVAVSSNFVLNRKYTFKRARELPLLFSYATYVGTNLAGLAVRMLVIQGMIALAGMDSGRNYVFMNFVGIILATLVNFVGAKFFAFAPERVEFPEEAASKRSSFAPAKRPWGVILLAAAALLYAFVSTVPFAQLSSGDEGVNVTMARNIQSSWQFFTRPSVYPGGRRDWLQEDVPSLGNLPTYPALLALAGRDRGFAGMALVSFFALCITVYSTGRMVALVDRKAGLYTAMLMACSPALYLAFRRIEFEPVLTALCAAGCYQLVRGVWERQRLRCLAGGLLIGFGFATKMWLILPYAFAVIAFCVVEAAAVRSSGQSAGLRRSVAVGGIGFVLAALSHVIYVAARSPADLSVWISSVYLGIFSGHGVTGAKLSAVVDYTRHRRSTIYYPLVLYRDHFFLLPLFFYGFGEVLRVPQVRRSRLLAMIIGALVAVVALSVPAYKDARYVLPTVPFLYALAGLCVSALSRSPDKLRPATLSVVRASEIVAVLAFAVVLVVHLAAAPWPVSGAYVLAHAFGTVLSLVLGELWIRAQFAPQKLAALAGVALAGFAIGHPRLVHRPPYAELAAALEPHLRAAPPAYPSFVARDSNILQGYLQRSGVTWEEAGETLGRVERDTSLRAFVFAADGASPAELKSQGWLEQNGRDLSSETSGAVGFRVFVR